MLEFDPADETSITLSIPAVIGQWKQHKDVEFLSGVSISSQEKHQLKIWLKADSFKTFEHCDATIRNAAILHMREATLSPITRWFTELQQTGGASVL
ncbi:hypothetical protein GCM10009720_16460 [Yaniella flava]|uniref:Uncharacterized protein n=1 Tax=Yaniella flava TaxID=287930 RepID=A0ABN2UFP3_9MICC|nr:hypothetical protein [Micrococcaceae bacterium]